MTERSKTGLTRGHLGKDRVRIRDELLQRGIADHLSLVVREIHADDQQLLLPLRPWTSRDHTIEIGHISRRLGGLLPALRIDQSRCGRSLATEPGHAGVVPSDHHFLAIIRLRRSARQISADFQLHSRGHSRRHFHRLQHTPRQIRQRQLALQRHTVNRDVIPRRHCPTSSIRVRLKHLSILQSRRARDLAATFVRSLRLHQQIAPRIHSLLQQGQHTRRQPLPHRLRHRQFQRPPRILINKVQHLLPALQSQLHALLPIQARRDKTLRPPPKLLKHRLWHRFLPKGSHPLRQHQVRRSRQRPFEPAGCCGSQTALNWCWLPHGCSHWRLRRNRHHLHDIRL